MSKQFEIQTKLMGLWISLMFLYIYADLFSFYRPGYIEKVISGLMGPLTVDQSILLASSVLMLIPIVMIILSITMKNRLMFLLNCIVGILYIFVNVSHLIGETWIYYLVYGIVEIVITLVIVRLSFKEFKGQSSKKG